MMFHLEKVHFMLEEMVMNGCIVETSKANILSPISCWIKLLKRNKTSIPGNFYIIIGSLQLLKV